MATTQPQMEMQKAPTEHANTQIQKLSANGLSLNDKQKAAKLLALGGLINKIRVVQGWNILSPGETVPMAEIWAEQLDRREVPPHIYGVLLDRCIDLRTRALSRGDSVPAFTVELLLTVYDQYRREARAAFEQAEQERKYGRT